ncbi:MAG TPA: MBL fold metallo-hydrolase [Thermomicrobiales bacterium]|nr:MBL fold metallo-hydrolase [Thermomicrobiales bacterium]
MEITFLGTAAAEGFPDPFCACENCTEARALRGTSFRYRSSALIDNQLLIDMGPDLIAASMRFGLPLNQVRYGLQTHPHNDHLDVLAFFARHEGCSVKDLTPMQYFCSATSLRRMNALESLESGNTDYADADEQRKRKLEISIIEPWQEFMVGDYRVQSVRATHGGGKIEAMLYAIEDPAGKRLFYGTDTGPLEEGTWSRLRDLGWTFDLFILDHTGGFGSGGTSHLDAKTFREEIAKAREAGVITDRTRVVATHFAHHSNPTHDKLAALTAEQGYEPAHDGLTIQVGE